MTWALTVALLLCASHNVLQALASRAFPARVSNSLHAVMNAVMAGMIWNFLPSTMLAQILILAGAALWFLIQAASGSQWALCTSRKNRLHCLYHSFTMTGAALMVAMMGHVTGPGPRTSPPGAGPTPPGHHDHSMAFPSQTMSPASADSSGLALSLTVLFGVAAVVFIIVLVRFQRTVTALHLPPGQRLYTSAGQGLEALGAAVMALMFATMSG